MIEYSEEVDSKTQNDRYNKKHGWLGPNLSAEWAVRRTTVCTWVICIT